MHASHRGAAAAHRSAKERPGRRRKTLNVYIYLALIVWSLVGIVLPRTSTNGAERVAPQTTPNLAWIGVVCCALLVLFELGNLVARADAHARPFRGANVRAPIALRTSADRADPATSDVDLLLALAQTACLFSLYRSLAGRRTTRASVTLVAIAAAAAATLAVTAPAAKSADMYLYLAYALAPSSPYLPVTVPFTGEHAVIDTFVGPNVAASYYGPLWIAVSKLAVAPFASLAAQLHALRCLDVLALAAIAAVAVWRGLPFATIGVLAVNPGVLGEWVVDGHNDLFGAMLVALALGARTRPAAQIVLIAAAGLVKLPLAIAGLFVFGDYAGLTKRLAFSAIALVLCAGASWAFGDRGGYLRHLAALSAERPSHAEQTFHYAALVLVLVALALALVRRRRVGTFAWIWPAIGAFPAAWYDCWGLPYALASGSAYAILIAFPVVSFVFSWNETETPLGAIVSTGAIVLPVAYALVMRVRFNRRSRAAPAALHAP